MMPPIRHMANENGTALLATLAVTAVLLISGLQLARLAADSVTTIEQDIRMFQAREMAMSGIHLAMMILADDAARTDTDSIQEGWADPEKLDQMAARLGFEEGQLSLVISDELGKLQVNALLSQFPGHEINTDQQQLWERFLSLRISTDKSEDDRDPTAIINSLKDWLDSEDDDAITGLTGAESAYYAGLEFPYACANGPVNYLSELLNVKGITPDLFESDTDESGAAESGEPDPGDLVTVYGLSDTPPSDNAFSFSGLININTAGPEILGILLPEGLEDLAADLSDFRSETSEDGETFVNALDKGWYTGVIDLSDEEKASFDELVRYSSHYFRVDARVSLGDVQTGIRAFVQRYQQKTSNQWACRLVQLEKDR